MTIDLRKKREEAGLSQDKLAQILDLTQSQVSRHEDNPENIPAGLLIKWLAALGISLSELEGELDAPVTGLDPGDPLASLWARLDLLADFCSHEDESKATMSGLPGLIEFKQTLAELRRKPNVVLTGRYDAGKSRMINTITGQQNLPTKRQPATRVVTHVRHVNDRPGWMAAARDEVWIFKEGADLAKLPDEDETRRHLITSGNLETLREYGAYGGKHEAVAEAELALVFSDAPVLRSCNFIDLPGFRGDDEKNSDTDAARARNAFPLVDVLIYASNATGFLDGVDFSFLGYLLRSVPAFEKVDSSFPTFGNLFVVATHAYKNIISERELNEDVLDIAARRLYRHFSGTVLAERSKLIERPITLEDVRRRFFGFLSESEPRRRALNDELKALLAKRLPIAQRKIAGHRIIDFKKRGTESVRLQIDACEKMLADLAAARKQYEVLVGQDELRRRTAAKARKNIEMLIDELSKEAVSLTGKAYASTINVDAVEKLIRDQYGSSSNGKDEAKKFAVSFTLEKLQVAIGERNAALAKKLELQVSAFVRGYDSLTLTPKKGGPIALDIPFDAQGAFLGGLGASGAIGALTFWAASLGNLGAYIIAGKAVSVLAALGISIPGGTAAVMAFIAAIGGPVTIAVGVFVAVGTLLWSLFGESWERRLAKKIVDEFHKGALLAKMTDGVVTYWNETQTAFARAADKIEAEYRTNLERYKSLLERPESSRKDLDTRLGQLRELAGFFERIPILPL